MTRLTSLFLYYKQIYIYIFYKKLLIHIKYVSKDFFKEEYNKLARIRGYTNFSKVLVKNGGFYDHYT